MKSDAQVQACGEDELAWDPVPGEVGRQALERPADGDARRIDVRVDGTRVALSGRARPRAAR